MGLGSCIFGSIKSMGLGTVYDMHLQSFLRLRHTSSFNAVNQLQYITYFFIIYSTFISVSKPMSEGAAVYWCDTDEESYMNVSAISEPTLYLSFVEFWPKDTRQRKNKP